MPVERGNNEFGCFIISTTITVALLFRFVNFRLTSNRFVPRTDVIGKIISSMALGNMMKFTDGINKLMIKHTEIFDRCWSLLYSDTFDEKYNAHVFRRSKKWILEIVSRYSFTIIPRTFVTFSLWFYIGIKLKSTLVRLMKIVSLTNVTYHRYQMC